MACLSPKLILALAICCLLFQDQKNFCARSLDLPNSGHIEYSPPVEPTSETIVPTKELASLVEYAQSVNKELESQSKRTQACVCEDNQEQPTTEAEVVAATKVESPKASKTQNKSKRYKVITIALPEDSESSADAVFETKTDKTIAEPAKPENKSSKTKVKEQVEVEANDDEPTDAKDANEESVEPKKEKLSSKKENKQKTKSTDKKRSKRDARSKDYRSKESQSKDGDRKSKYSKGSKSRK